MKAFTKVSLRVKGALPVLIDNKGLVARLLKGSRLHLRPAMDPGAG